MHTHTRARRPTHTYTHAYTRRQTDTHTDTLISEVWKAADVLDRCLWNKWSPAEFKQYTRLLKPFSHLSRLYDTVPNQGNVIVKLLPTGLSLSALAIR